MITQKRSAHRFISGKDSMFNDFSGYDAGEQAGQSLRSPDSPYLLHRRPCGCCKGGLDRCESRRRSRVRDRGDCGGLGGSEYFAHLGCPGNTVPKLDAAAAKVRYTRNSDAISHELVASALPGQPRGTWRCSCKSGDCRPARAWILRSRFRRARIISSSRSPWVGSW